MSRDPTGPPAKFHPAQARKWKPWAYGPPEQWLRCQGNLPARIVARAHYLWPWDRGHWRLMRILSKSGLMRRHLQRVPFRSACGVPVHLDVATDRFLFLSGRLCTEPLEIAVASRIVRPGDCFIDIGAHWGLYILHILGRLGDSGRYYAIEPSHSSFRFLGEAFSSADPRLRLLEIAVSEFDGEGSLVEEGSVNGHLGAAQAGSVKVQVSRLDTLFRESRLEPGRVFIKADTEGHEAAVIRSCRGLASAGVRPIFLLEFLPERFGQTRADVIDAITTTLGTGYTYWSVDGDKGCLVRFNRSDEPRADIRNILAIPPESLDRVLSCPHQPQIHLMRDKRGHRVA